MTKNLKKKMMTYPSKPYTFASHKSQLTSQSLQKSMSFQPHGHSDTTDRQTTKDRRAACNRRLAQWRVTWLIEHSTSHQLLWFIDSFELRNPPLRQAPNCYLQY